MNILITGSSSMVGRQVVSKLSKNNKLLTPNKNELNALYLKDLREYFNKHRPEQVIMLAGYNGGLAWNRKFPFDIFCETTLMGLNTIKCCVEFNVSKVVFPISSCSLNYHNNGTFFESDLLVGKPHESVLCHGLGKRYVYECGLFANQQYGLNFNGVIAQNSFGPHDRFNERGKVISGMIQRMYEAKENKHPVFTVYGDGTVLREFLYSKDFAEGLIQVLEKYNDIFPINLTSGYEISIKDLSYKIKELIGYEGDIVFTGPEHNGQPRRVLNKERMDHYLDVKITDFDVALKETIDWYVQNVN